MELVGLIVCGVFAILWLYDKLFSEDPQIEQRRIERDSEERRSPVQYCSECRKPNKTEGSAHITSPMTTVGTSHQSRHVCSECRRQHDYCPRCGKRTLHLFRRYSTGAKLCKHCFESERRDWSDTRRAAIEYHGASCDICGSERQLQVHHITYARKGHELLSDLVVLCKWCHLKQHSTVYIGERGGRYIKRDGRKIYVSEEETEYSRAPVKNIPEMRAEKQANITMHTNVCDICSKAFKTQYETKKYCSDKCEVERRRRYDRIRDATPERKLRKHRIS